MSHFAKLDNNNIVTQVIVAEQDFINSGAVGDSFRWVQTSYNNNMRKNYAGIGCVYDSVRDAFIKKQPYSSWIFDEDTCQWNAPITEPEGTRNIWDELNGVWVKRF